MINKLKRIFHKSNLYITKTFLLGLYKRIFNRSNINKIIIIFIFGFTSRIIVNNIYNINVYSDYFNSVSIIYYLFMSLFIVIIHELVNYFDINIIPYFVTEIPTFVINLPSRLVKYASHISNTIIRNISYLILDALKELNKSISSYKIFKIKVSSIIRHFNVWLMRNKVTNNKSYDNIVLLNYFKIFKIKISSVIRHFNFWFMETKNKILVNVFYDHTIKGIKSKNTYNNYSGRHSISRVRGVDNLNGLIKNNDSKITNQELAFRIDTIRPNSYTESRDFITPSPVAPMPAAPIPSTLTTPSMESVTGMFESYPPYPISQRNNSANLVQDNKKDTRYTPSQPQIHYAPQDGARVLYSGYDSAKSSYNTLPVSNYPVVNNTEYYEDNYRYSYPVPAEVPYFNAERISIESNKATMGLNGSNENMWMTPNRESVDWAQRRYMAEKNIIRDNLEFKEVVVPSNSEMPNEILIRNSSVRGRLKLAFNFLDARINKTISNMDSIAIDYHDKSKRKFFWVIWEKRSGNYESYEDFKNSWDPKTNIWKEITRKTHRDMQVDVEGILGVKSHKNLEYHKTKRIEPIARRPHINKEVNSLLYRQQPFSRPRDEVVITESNHKSSGYKDKSSHSSKHSSSRHKHSSSSRKKDGYN